MKQKKKIKTCRVVSQDRGDFLDVYCYAKYAGGKWEWCQLVSLDKGVFGAPGTITLPEFTEHGKGDAAFEQVPDSEVPNEILAALAVEVGRAVQEILVPAREALSESDKPKVKKREDRPAYPAAVHMVHRLYLPLRAAAHQLPGYLGEGRGNAGGLPAVHQLPGGLPVGPKHGAREWRRRLVGRHRQARGHPVGQAWIHAALREGLAEDHRQARG